VKKKDNSINLLGVTTSECKNPGGEGGEIKRIVLTISKNKKFVPITNPGSVRKRIV
jgi:hypothetical protein